MTPLTRWVLLALLWVVVDAHPDEHACVCLCRARNGSPKIAEVCDHQQNHLLRSSGPSLLQSYLLQRLFKLCLTPYCDPRSPRYLLFDDSEFCRFLRHELIQRHGCSCDTLSNGKSGRPEEEEQEFKYIEQYVLKKLDVFKTREHVAALLRVLAYAEDQQGSSSKDLPEEQLKVSVAEDRLEAMDADTANASEDETDSTEDPVDWDLWCMAQCNNGQGGSACHCDIIP